MVSKLLAWVKRAVVFVKGMPKYLGLAIALFGAGLLAFIVREIFRDNAETVQNFETRRDAIQRDMDSHRDFLRTHPSL
jgi:ABC-type uncharacterized transport system permease subunit